VRQQRPIGLFLISLFKLGKALLLIALGIGVLNLMDRDIGELFMDLVEKLHINTENGIVQHILLKLDLIDVSMLKEISLGTFLFAGILLIEGGGLLFQMIWAEYMAVVETAIFIPFELQGTITHASTAKSVLLVINIAVVLYLVFLIMRKARLENQRR
jgi:uncharacterized membrane protein (DUF2068 family)